MDASRVSPTSWEVLFFPAGDVAMDVSLKMIFVADHNRQERGSPQLLFSFPFPFS